MFDKEFDEPIESEILQMVEQFEEAFRNAQNIFFEHSTFEHIIEYYEQRRNLSRASQVVEIAIEQYPFSAVFLVKKAEFLTEQKRYEEASELLEKAYTLDPNDINIHLGMTDILVWQGKHEEAIELLRGLIRSTDKIERADLYLELADIYEDREQYMEVISCLKSTLDLVPQSEEALNRLWFAYELTEMYDDSAAFHKQIIDGNPYNHIAWYNLGHAYNGLQQYDRAVEAFGFVMAIDDTFDAAYSDCAEILMRLERYEEAITILEDCLVVVRKPKKDICFSIGLCYEHLEEFRKARYFFRKAVSIDKCYHEAFFKLGENYVMDGDYDKAIGAYKQAVELRKDEVLYQTALANAYESLEQFHEASQVYRRIQEMDPGVKEHWINLANSLFSESLFGDALDLLDDAAVVFTEDADIHYIKCVYNYFLGNRKEAIYNLEVALIKSYEDYPMIFTMNEDLGRDDEIIAIIQSYDPMPGKN